MYIDISVSGVLSMPCMQVQEIVKNVIQIGEGFAKTEILRKCTAYSEEKETFINSLKPCTYPVMCNGVIYE